MFVCLTPRTASLCTPTSTGWSPQERTASELLEICIPLKQKEEHTMWSVDRPRVSPVHPLPCADIAIL